MTALFVHHADRLIIDRLIRGDDVDTPFGLLGHERPAWTLDALCALTPEIDFFPPRGGSTAPAKAVCRDCTVREECLDFAIDNREKFGVWGGLSERERRRVRRSRSLGLQEAA